METQKRTLMLLPALNEEDALRKLVNEFPPEYDVLVVDSHSTDNTVKVAEEAGYACIPVKYGRGQGSGVRTGMEYFLEKGYDYLLLADCDYTDDPRGLPKVLDRLIDGGYDVVIGVRDFKKQREYLGLPPILVKKTVSLLIWMLTGLRVRDMLTGVWAFWKSSVEKILPMLHERGFEYGFEILYNAWKLKMGIGETDVDFRRRIGHTKLTLRQRVIQVYYGIKYGLKVIRTRVVDR